MRTTRNHLVTIALGAVVALTAVSGCSDSSDSSDDEATPSGAPSAATSGAGAGAAGVAAAVAFIDSLKTAAPLSGGLPVTPPEGKRLGILSCGTAATACRDIALEATEAAELLGWKATTVDGKTNAQGYASGLSQLVSQKVDAIISVAASDGAAPAAHKAAAAAGIPVVCIFCANKLVAPIPNPSVVNIEVDYAAQGKANAAFVAAQTEGAGRAAVLTFDLSAADKVRQTSFASSLKSDCPGCSVVATSAVTGDDVVAATRQATAALLAKHGKGELDFIVTPADSFSPGAVQAVKLAGRSDVKVISYDCDPSALAAIRGDTAEVACADTPLLESGYAAVDVVARLLAGQTPADVTLPFSYVTESNVPAEGKTATTSDYIAYFSQLWGR